MIDGYVDDNGVGGIKSLYKMYIVPGSSRHFLFEKGKIQWN